MRGDDISRLGGRPDIRFSWKAVALWLAIGAAILAAVMLLRLPERMGCRSFGARQMICDRSLFSPQTWTGSAGRGAQR